jgi:hypothetical protein
MRRVGIVLKDFYSMPPCSDGRGAVVVCSKRLDGFGRSVPILKAAALL